MTEMLMKKGFIPAAPEDAPAQKMSLDTLKEAY
jgi:hypothetical protein